MGFNLVTHMNGVRSRKGLGRLFILRSFYFIYLNNYSTSACWMELATIISYPTSASGIIVLSKTRPKYEKLKQNKS